MMSYQYPYSRVKISGDCEMCRIGHGCYQQRNVLTLQGLTGKEVKLLQLTCNYCGHTLLFDFSVVRTVPYQGDGNEVLPDFEAKLS
jgi:hypothetical protein